MKLHIRPATKEDLPVLLEFEQGLIAAERPMDPSIRRERVHYYDLEEFLKDPDRCLLVGELDGQAVPSPNAYSIGVGHIQLIAFFDFDARRRVVHHGSSIAVRASRKVVHESQRVPDLMGGELPDPRKRRLDA